MSTASTHVSTVRKGGECSPSLPRENRHVLVVCTGEECARAGSLDLLSDLKHECRSTRADVRVGASRCLGHCQLAPAMMEDGRMMGWVSLRRLHSELQRLGIKD